MPHSKDAEEGQRVWNSRDSAEYNFGEQRIGLGCLWLYQEPWQLVKVQVSWEMGGIRLKVVWLQSLCYNLWEELSLVEGQVSNRKLSHNVTWTPRDTRAVISSVLSPAVL